MAATPRGLRFLPSVVDQGVRLGLGSNGYALVGLKAISQGLAVPIVGLGS